MSRPLRFFFWFGAEFSCRLMKTEIVLFDAVKCDCSLKIPPEHTEKAQVGEQTCFSVNRTHVIALQYSRKPPRRD